MRKVETDEAPEPLGPYSQAIVHGDTVHCAGQGPAVPDTREVEAETVADQTRQAMENVSAILEAAGSSIENAVKVTVYMADMDDFDEMNAAYEEYVTEPYPARAAVEVARLPVDGIAVEIDVTAAV